MGIRRSYNFNTQGAGRLDGIYINDPCDLHFRQYGVYTPAPYGLDADASTRLQIGDAVGSRPNSASLPVQVVGGFHQNKTNINSTPYNVTADDAIILADTTGGAITINLPSIASYPGKILRITKKVRANNLTITPNGGDTVDGFTGTQFFLFLPQDTITLYADATNGNWIRLKQNFFGQYLQHEFSLSPTYSNATSGFTTVRTWSNVAFSSRDVLAMVSGSGWYNNAEHAIAEFAVFVDGSQGPLIAWWQSMSLQINSPFSGHCLFYNTPGLHTVDLRARVRTGSHTFSMDNNDFLIFDLFQI